MTLLKKFLHTINNFFYILLFVSYYLYKNPKHSWREQKMVRLIATIHPLIPKFFARLRGLIKNKTKYKFITGDKYDDHFLEEINSCVSSLRNEGYYIFNQKLTNDQIYRIKDSLKKIPSNKRLGLNKNIIISEDSSILEGIYDYDEKDLINNEILMEIAINPIFHNISNLYFRSNPVFESLASWWSFPDKKTNLNLNAQLFHSDRERLAFIKFFIYLTDVNSLNGPHVVMPKSHRKRPFKLRGDKRFEDEIINYYYNEKATEIFGSAGTIVAVDTQCLHKGKELTKGNRLIFEFQYSSDFMGGDPGYIYNKNFNKKITNEFLRYPDVFTKFINN